MGLLQKISVGMEISHDGLAAVLLCKKAGTFIIKQVIRTTFPAETIRHSLKELQILQPEAFVGIVRDVWSNLHLSTRNVALSLPDSSGRLILTRLEEPWKQHDEATALIRWKLAKKLGLDQDQLHLDFQVLKRHENGATDLLVALINRNVIRQYEELFREAGLQSVKIGFNTLHLLRLFDSEVSTAEQIITLYDDTLGIITLANGRPVFYRVKRLSSGVDQFLQLRRELTSSLAASRQICDDMLPATFRIITAPGETVLAEMLSDMFGVLPEKIFIEKLFQQNSQSAATNLQLFQSSAALGAALGGF